MVANSQGLQQLTDNLSKITQKFDMKIHVKLTKMMRISKDRKMKVKICIDGQMVEQVEEFRYLGSLTSEEGYCKNDIRSRNDITKKAFMDKKESKINLKLKKRIMKCLIWSVALYAADVDTDESGCPTVGGFRNVDVAKNGKNYLGGQNFKQRSAGKSGGG